jgi:DNA-binding LacI/PurR family transcriptional regulator
LEDLVGQQIAFVGGRRAQEVSLVGLGNTPWAQWLTPPLSSVSLNEERMAKLAILLADEEMPEMPEVVRVQPHLVERDSVHPQT